jgi:hypothetical protein
VIHIGLAVPGGQQLNRRNVLTFCPESIVGPRQVRRERSWRVIA